jgi:threonylcarbamoyladenosine tRNA methylthiotransferase MtaB
MKIYLDVIGCRLNQSEIEKLANQFRALGHQIVSEPENADVAIVNTCTVTIKAAADSRKQLRRASRKGAQAVIATGCWATLAPEAALDLQGVTKVVINQNKGSLVADILNKSPEEISALPIIRQPIPGERTRTRAFIKVQEGCDNRCTYCLTRVARGRSRSVELSQIQKDIQAALDGGAKEIVLTGVQLGGWGKDFVESKRLKDLLAGLLSNTDITRLRLSSIEPWEFDLSMLNLWQDDRLCRHLHIPLQSGSDRILSKMGRPITVGAYQRLVEEVRSAIPGVAITTDVIVGFPGEDQADFESTKWLIKTIGFAGGHVFTYSPRPGTPAYQMQGQVPRQIAKARNADLREVFKQSSRNYRDSFIGLQADVLWESSQCLVEGKWRLSGLTGHYIRVFSVAETDLSNRITSVTLSAHHQDREALFGWMGD